jgi:NAD+ synthase (glutamine-hydrolysing)
MCRIEILTTYRFTPQNPSTELGLNGVGTSTLPTHTLTVLFTDGSIQAEIILNSSASHAELRKLRTRLELISNSTRKLGGIYVYANASGVDGDARIMVSLRRGCKNAQYLVVSTYLFQYDGSSMVLMNGKVFAQSSQFSLKPVDV